MSLVCMSGSDGLLVPDNCKPLRNVRRYMQNTRTLSHTAPFYWNSWTSHIPAWKVNSCRLCCITHEGKTQQLLFLPASPGRTKLVPCKWMHACAHTQTYFKGDNKILSNHFKQWNVNFLLNPEVSKCASTQLHQESLHMVWKSLVCTFYAL